MDYAIGSVRLHRSKEWAVYAVVVGFLVVAEYVEDLRGSANSNDALRPRISSEAFERLGRSRSPP